MNAWSFLNALQPNKMPVVHRADTAKQNNICQARELHACGFDDCPCVKALKYRTVAEEMIKGRFAKGG